MRAFILIIFLGVLFTNIENVGAKNPERQVLKIDTIKSQMDILNKQLSEGAIDIYARSRGTTPFFYLSDFPDYYGNGTGGTLILDDWKQMDPLEFVALPNTAMKVHSILMYSGVTLLEVTTSEYPYDDDKHYIDARFVTIIQSTKPISERMILLGSQTSILREMKQQVGMPYIWGGNTPKGVQKMLDLYKPSYEIDGLTQAKWTIQGFDCSGLLYWATNGYTPRNTSKLITFGTGVEIEGKTIEEIAKIIKPLDTIVWKGHDRIVLDKHHIIESTINFTSTGNYSEPNGVRIVNIMDSLRDITEDKKRTPVNDWDKSTLDKKEKFVIRRWYPGL